MTTKTELLNVIRKHCLACCGGSHEEVKRCTASPDAAPYSTCELWPYRLGKDPTPARGAPTALLEANAKKKEGI